ncbi:MAG TPA: DUF2950 family protein, partial [Planctomycetota bacterium]|nr:DUF2950 family protein [Planctomycetota bacterium]
PDSAAGKKGRCTVCGAITVIPSSTIEIEEPSENPPPVQPPDPNPDIKIVEPELIAPPAPSVPTAPATPASAPTAPKAIVGLAPTAPEKKSLSCAMLAVFAVGVLFVLAAIAGVLFWLLVWPQFKNRFVSTDLEIKAPSTIHLLETAEESYRDKFSFYSSRISGDPSLQSAGMLGSDAIAAAEAPPGPAKPFGGYVFRILSAQGAHAPGGSVTYRDARGQMKSKYAILAYPAQYGDAKRTFLRGPDGAIYAKDFGNNTARIAEAIKNFDPDESWTRTK